MLSNSAFNALLKTLEEPPAHVKFIFATTEARKIPVTILSRCQRFDLKRLTTEGLAAHLKAICEKEQVEMEPEALTLLSIAAEGSVRDGLSLLDRAIAHNSTEGQSTIITALAVRSLLGMADRSHTLQLVKHVLEGNVQAALSGLRESYTQGADPVLVLQDMLELAHFITRAHISAEALDDPSYSAHERQVAGEMAKALCLPVLARLWQMLLKGLGEVKQAPSALAAAEMILVRIAYASTLPTPEQLLRQGGGDATQSPAPAHISPSASQTTALAPAQQAPEPPPPEVEILDSFEGMVALLERKKEALLASQLKQFASLVSFAQGKVVLHMKGGLAARELPAKISQLLTLWCGQEWKVLVSAETGADTLHDQQQQKRAVENQAASQHPVVASVLKHFPGAEVVDVKTAQNT